MPPDPEATELPPPASPLSVSEHYFGVENVEPLRAKPLLERSDRLFHLASRYHQSQLIGPRGNHMGNTVYHQAFEMQAIRAELDREVDRLHAQDQIRQREINASKRMMQQHQPQYEGIERIKPTKKKKKKTRSHRNKGAGKRFAKDSQRMEQPGMEPMTGLGGNREVVQAQRDDAVVVDDGDNKNEEEIKVDWRIPVKRNVRSKSLP